jgi:hypothetical protein
LINTCWTIKARPNSRKPTTIRKNTGATTANSVAAAPHLDARSHSRDRLRRVVGAFLAGDPFLGDDAPIRTSLKVRNMIGSAKNP